MLYVIENKKINATLKNEKIYLPQKIKSMILDNFKELKSSGLNIWNGEIICVSQYSIEKDFVNIICKKSNYAHYLYGEKIGLPKEYECKNISAGCILKTQDDFYVIGELGKFTSYPNMLQTTGGNIDEKKDINNENINFMNTIIREAKEELNIDLEDNTLIFNNIIKYMYIEESDKQRGVRILSKAKIKMTSEELKEHFEKHNKYLIKNNLETEFDKLHFINKNRILEDLDRLQNPQREYLINILKYEAELNNKNNE